MWSGYWLTRLSRRDVVKNSDVAHMHNPPSQTETHKGGVAERIKGSRWPGKIKVMGQGRFNAAREEQVKGKQEREE